MNRISYKSILLFALLIMAGNMLSGQNVLPDELTKNSMKEQLKYIEDHTRIYENYRAVREDIFQKINKNILDSLSAKQSRITELENLASDLRAANESQKIILETTTSSLNEMTATKNSISVLGIEVRKNVYNTTMWTIILILVVILAIGFIIFKRNMFVTIRTGKEFNDLKAEFEAYRQSARIAREKLQMDHFNEIKRLKAK